MNKLLITILLCSAAYMAIAQTNSITQAPGEEPYGTVDTADLKMTACDFEKDANAEILFDKSEVHTGSGLIMDRHIRIKIFNDFGKKNANVRLLYQTVFLGGKGVADVEGETINLDEKGAIVVTPLDKSQIFTEKIVNNISAVVFTFPNVKAGSVIEYKYRGYASSTWFFQNSLPTRYSEMVLHYTGFPGFMTARDFVNQPMVSKQGAKGSGTNIWSMSNIHSLPDEPYMTARRTNLERIEFRNWMQGPGTWGSIANQLIAYKGFGAKLDETLPGEEAIIKKANSLLGDEERVAFIFDTVKYSMKWNGVTSVVSSDDIKSAWKKKSGNSAEMNLIVYHLLRQIGIEAYPMIVCTREYGRLDPETPDVYSINNTVVHVPVGQFGFFTLDASNRFNIYNTIPYNLLNSYGISINPPDAKTKTVLMRDTVPVLQTLVINAEIEPSGKMTGNAEITSNSYNLVDAVKRYKTYGEQKYLDTLRKLDNNLTISSYKMENASVDAGPLSETFDFNLNLNSTDDNYIFFNTNLFSQMEENPFKSENRYTDINLGYRKNFSMNGVYKIPAGYKIEALPKSITIVMPDQSIVFKRTVAQDNGTILIRYSINHKQTIYYTKSYQDLRGFYKKMYELLNEQVILKKG